MLVSNDLEGLNINGSFVLCLDKEYQIPDCYFSTVSEPPCVSFTFFYQIKTLLKDTIYGSRRLTIGKHGRGRLVFS